jgi:cob(I)alamin adenosyltransferase
LLKSSVWPKDIFSLLKGEWLTQQKPVNNSEGKLEKGLVSVFTGQGKGKTTAAAGIAVRAAGHGLKVFFCFFLKGIMYDYGEMKSFKALPNITVESYGIEGWAKKDEAKVKDKEQAALALKACRQAMFNGKYNVIIMDEVNIATYLNLLEVEEVLELIEEKPAGVELILTGNFADPRLVKKADLVSEILATKHPYNEGVKARQGIDY